MPERESASSMLVSACLNLRPPVIAPSAAPPRPPSRPPIAPPTPPALFSLKTTDGVTMKSAATIWPLPTFWSRCSSPDGAEGALLHHVAHADAALDDLEAVRLLDHHADHRRRRAEAVALQVLADLALRLDDGQRSLRRIAALELGARALRLAVGAGTAGGERAALAERLRRGRAGGQGERGQGEGEFRGHGILLRSRGDCFVARRAGQPSGPCLSASDVNESA